MLERLTFQNGRWPMSDHDYYGVGYGKLPQHSLRGGHGSNAHAYCGEGVVRSKLSIGEPLWDRG